MSSAALNGRTFIYTTGSTPLSMYKVYINVRPLKGQFTHQTYGLNR